MEGISPQQCSCLGVPLWTKVECSWVCPWYPSKWALTGTVSGLYGLTQVAGGMTSWMWQGQVCGEDCPSTAPQCQVRANPKHLHQPQGSWDPPTSPSARLSELPSPRPPSLPDVRQKVLCEARVHEDLLHFLATHIAIEVQVCLQEDLVKAHFICHRYYPGHWQLKGYNSDFPVSPVPALGPAYKTLTDSVRSCNWNSS